MTWDRTIRPASESDFPSPGLLNHPGVGGLESWLVRLLLMTFSKVI